MRKESLEFLRKLIEAPSPSGYEQPAQKIVRRYMEPYASEVRTDVHGNVIGVCNPGGKLRVMLAGHCDEIGFMVTHITNEGYIHFAAIGGVDAVVAVSQRAYIHTGNGKILGAIGRKAIHLMDADDRKKVPKIEDLWLDIGAKDKKEAQKLVEIGDPITFTAGFEPLRNNLAVARGFDDRVGAFVATETLRLLRRKKPKVAVYAVSTVQEELGLRGAKTSAFGVDPHVGIAIDVGHATDYPGAEKKRVGDVAVGKGPILHRGANINPVVGKRLIDTAKRRKIPYQLTGEPRATGTDANAIQLTRSGVAAALVSIPNRYMHTPVEVVSLDDLDNAAKLLAEFCLSLSERADFTP